MCSAGIHGPFGLRQDLFIQGKSILNMRGYPWSQPSHEANSRAEVEGVSGERELDQLLKNIDPRLDPTRYVFCTVAKTANLLISATTPLATFQEDEGLSLVLTEEQAQRHGLSAEPAMCRIILGKHSSKDVVGLTAAVSQRLMKHGVSANVVAAYHHDYIFVPADHAEEALLVLKDLSSP